MYWLLSTHDLYLHIETTMFIHDVEGEILVVFSGFLDTR